MVFSEEEKSIISEALQIYARQLENPRLQKYMVVQRRREDALRLSEMFEPKMQQYAKQRSTEFDKAEKKK